MKDPVIRATYVDHMGDDLRVVNAARISYGKQKEALDEKDVKLINYLAKNKHMSPFEHNILTVVVECPLYIKAQIHRHRTFSYNEMSRRYSNENVEIHVPDELRTQGKINKQGSSGECLDFDMTEALLYRIRTHNEACVQLYNDLIEKGVANEQARAVLPVATMTKFYMTGNLRNWVHFIELRDHHGAQKETQLLAREIKAILMDKFPNATQALLENK